MRPLHLFVPVCLFLVFLIACQKEINFTVDSNNGGGGGTQSTYGWSFTGNTNTSYKGCVDTGYIEMAGPAKILSIEASDTAGNDLSISIIGASGTISASTYSAAQGTAIIILETPSDIYSSPTGTFSIQVSSINDTLIQASFAGDLVSSSGGPNFKITNGKVKALINKVNPCSTSSGGSGGGGGGGNGNAVFALAGAPGSCSNADVLGNYIRNVAMNSTHTVDLDVNVSVIGNWNITTSTVNGISFSGSGSFNSTGLQTITLQASGTPTLYGSNTIPVSTGSSQCSFIVPVDTIPAAPCNPANNTAQLQGVNNINFYSVSGAVFGGTYVITANGTGGDMRLHFAGTSRPTAGVYNIEFSPGDLNNGEVLLDFTASNIYWQPSANGQVFVTVNNNKVTAVLCSIPISGSLGGPSFNSTATAKVTEQ